MKGEDGVSRRNQTSVLPELPRFNEEFERFSEAMGQYAEAMIIVRITVIWCVMDQGSKIAGFCAAAVATKPNTLCQAQHRHQRSDSLLEVGTGGGCGRRSPAGQAGRRGVIWPSPAPISGRELRILLC